MYQGCICHIFLCITNVSEMYHGCTVVVIALYLSCITDVLELVPYSGPTLLFSFIPWPSPLWGPAHQGIQFLASAGHGYGSWGVGAAMAWQHQTCFSAGRACTFQHAQLGALQQKPLLGMHPDGAPTVQAPDLTYWAAVGGQTGSKQQ